MTLDALHDTPLDTILMLACGAANADLMPLTGEDVVVLTAPYAAEPSTVGQQALPLLAAHRLREAGTDQGQHSRYTDSVIRVEYYAPVTPHDKRATRNALLRHVLNSVSYALQMGRHNAVSGGANVLSQAGLRYVRGLDTATYGEAPSTRDGGVYPRWYADLTFAECHPATGALVDVDGLDDFLRMRTAWLDEHHEDALTLPAGDGPLLDENGRPLLDQVGQGLRSN